MNIVFFHGFAEKPNLTFIFNFRYSLVNYYLADQIAIIKHNYKQLSSVFNDVKLRLHVIDQQKTYFVMYCTTAISSVANTINKLHIYSDLFFTKKNSIVIKKIKWINFLMNTIFPY